MTKTVFVNRYFYPDHSATSQLLSDLAFELAHENTDVHVVSSRQRYDDADARLVAEENCQGVHVHRVWTSRFGRNSLPGRAMDYLTFYFSAAGCLWRILRRGDVVVAKTDPPLISVIAMVMAKLRGAQLINWVQDLFPEVAEALDVRVVHASAPLLRYLRNMSLRAATRNVVLGERMAARLLTLGVAPNAVTIIHNWSDADVVHPVKPNENTLRDAWNLSGKFVVAYSGNMGRAHEFKTLIDAAEQCQGDARIVFLFIGSGAQRPLIEEMVTKRGLTNVLFKPYQPREQLALSLSVPDVHVISLMPELEGLIVPSKFYGIAAAGRPTLFIGDTDGEIARILHSSHCGVAASIGDVAAVTRAINCWAYDQPQLAEAQGNNARHLFEQQFTQSCAFSAWRQVLSQQLGVALLWLMLCIPSLTLAAPVAGTHPEAKQFKVFDATLYRNKPRLESYGIEPIEVLYAARFWPDTRSSRLMEHLPDEYRVRRLGRDLRAVRKPVVIDIEHWPLEGDEAQMRVNLAKYITVLQWLKNEAPSLNIGYFGRLPSVAYHWSLENENSQHYRTWQDENARLDNFSELVDTIYLPLYTYYPDREAWVKYATAHLREARRYGKPVYVFLWPQYSEQNKELSQQYLPADYWRLQLETAMKYADGIVIWGGWDGARNAPALWDDSAPWWQVTREFMHTLSLRPKAMVLSDQKH